MSIFYPWIISKVQQRVRLLVFVRLNSHIFFLLDDSSHRKHTKLFLRCTNFVTIITRIADFRTRDS